MGAHGGLRGAVAAGRREPGLNEPAAPGARVCRVVPDVAAVERAFDYLVPAELAGQVRAGTVVRVPLHGRRVRGWVVADGVEPETGAGRLLPLAAVVSEGPPAAVVDLTAWAAHRWAGPRVALLRSASPPNRVAPGSIPPRPPPAPPTVAAAGSDGAADGLAAAAAARPVAVVRWPPLLDRRRLVAGLLAPAGSTVVVVADTGRAAGLARWLAGTGRRAVLLRGDDPGAVRTAAWREAAAGGCVVVGGRVAALAPVPDLAAAVVADDADEALQEERAPTWHARDLLLERARRAGARCTVVSPAPTPAALLAAGADGVLALPADVERQGWPPVEVVDRREEPPGAGLLSAAFTDAARRTLARGEPVVCILNRRGRQRLLACGACHTLVRHDRTGTPHWDAAAADPGAPALPPGVCPACGATGMRVLRAGVARVREELAALLHLPDADVRDVDATSEAAAPAAVVVGTEAALHRAGVRRARPGLVAFLDFDQELLAPRARAAEQALWLLVRGARLLAGRSRAATRLLVQTRLPGHDAVEAARLGDPGRVADAELARRRALHLPPFGALAELSGDAAAVEAAAASLGAAGARVVGPTARDGAARALVRADDPAALAAALAGALPAARAHGRLRVAVDPPRA